MVNLRSFLTSTSIFASQAAFHTASWCSDYSSYSTFPHEPKSSGALGLPYMRPPPECRTFTSPAVEVGFSFLLFLCFVCFVWLYWFCCVADFGFCRKSLRIWRLVWRIRMLRGCLRIRFLIRWVRSSVCVFSPSPPLSPYFARSDWTLHFACCTLYEQILLSNITTRCVPAQYVSISPSERLTIKRIAGGESGVYHHWRKETFSLFTFFADSHSRSFLFPPGHHVCFIFPHSHRASLDAATFFFLFLKTSRLVPNGSATPPINSRTTETSFRSIRSWLTLLKPSSITKWVFIPSRHVFLVFSVFSLSRSFLSFPFFASFT